MNKPVINKRRSPQTFFKKKINWLLWYVFVLLCLSLYELYDSIVEGTEFELETMVFYAIVFFLILLYCYAINLRALKISNRYITLIYQFKTDEYEINTCTVIQNPDEGLSPSSELILNFLDDKGKILKQVTIDASSWPEYSEIRRFLYEKL